jgi:plasmid stabilization system protein ParE
VSTGIRWSSKALGEVARLHALLELVDPRAAARVVQALTTGVRVLKDNPRLGVVAAGFEQREVRRLLVGSYEVRYELLADAAVILRLWHTRKDSRWALGLAVAHRARAQAEDPQAAAVDGARFIDQGRTRSSAPRAVRMRVPRCRSSARRSRLSPVTRMSAREASAMASRKLS